MKTAAEIQAASKAQLRTWADNARCVIEYTTALRKRFKDIYIPNPDAGVFNGEGAW